jgi:hypothetical protein
MNHAATIACWVLAWFALSAATTATWAAARGHESVRDRAFAIAAAAALIAAGLAWTGTVLW